MTVRRALAALVALSASTSVSGLDTSKDRPVMKVVRLLQDMKSELEKELDDDKSVHEKLTCWCKDNDQEKTAAIEAGNQQAEQLKASLSEDAAKVVELKGKRSDTMAEITSDQKALDSATALRMQEKKAFHAEEVDLVEAVKACKQAVTVLSGHNPSMAQVQSVAKMLQTARVQELAVASLGNFGAKVLRQFLHESQSTKASFLGVPGFNSYAPRSGQIFGILQQMQADFEASLSDSQKAELKAQEEFASLRDAKTAELAGGKKQVVDLDSQVADLGEKAVQETAALDDTEGQLALDTEFLGNLQSKCTTTDEEFASRTKSRLDEIAAVEDTIAILNNDTSFDLFGKTTASDAFFLQTDSATSRQQRRTRAAAVLQRAAARGGAPGLVLLAASVQLDAFSKVKAEIDKMVVTLKKQQSDEVGHRDWCIKGLNENNRSTEASYDDQASLQAKIADLEKELGDHGKKIDEVKAAYVEAQKQMKRASEVREGENADFQLTVGDQRMTQQILQKALTRMQQVYAMVQTTAGDEPQPGAAHIATSGNHTDPGNGPARFTKYDQNVGGSRVVSMLQKVIADSRQTEDAAMQAEQDAQTAYESFMKDSNKALKQYMETMVHRMKAKSAAKSAHVDTQTDLKGTLKELEELNDAAGGLHKSCDFVLRNFDARQEARAAEVSALGDAKAVLSGLSS